MATQTLITEAQFDALPEEVRDQHELLDGELIELASPVPVHHRLVAKLITSFEVYLEASQLGCVMADAEFSLIRDSRLRPDVAVLLGAKWQSLDQWRTPITVIPDIAIEIVSPSESAYHVQGKNQVYRESGVSEIWTVYPLLQGIDADSNDSRRWLSMKDSLSTSLLPGWDLSLVKLFSGLTQTR